MNISPIESQILLSININHISSGKMFLAQGPSAKNNLSPFLDNFHPAFVICATSPWSTALQVRKWVWNKSSTGSTVECVSDLGDKTWCGCGWAVRAAASLGLQPGNCTKPTVRDPHHFFFLYTDRCTSLATCHAREKLQRWQEISGGDYGCFSDWFPLPVCRQKIAELLRHISYCYGQ